jgi:hypothetical protein
MHPDTLSVPGNLEKVYLRTAKLLNSFKAKEALWRQEKKALKDEVIFLKTLLKHDQHR